MYRLINPISVIVLLEWLNRQRPSKFSFKSSSTLKLTSDLKETQISLKRASEKVREAQENMNEMQVNMDKAI